jgi:succinyl-diaminopimelate desuccinylase
LISTNWYDFFYGSTLMFMEKEIISLLTDFVSFQSVDGNNKEKEACLDWVVQTFFQNVRNEISRGEVDGCPYVYIAYEKPDFCWFAHTDVVPATPDQFSVSIKEGKAYGRGVKDMKGAALPFLLAYKHAIENTENPRISLLLTSDEETAGKSIPHLLQNGIVDAPVAFTPDTGSSPGIVTAHKGVVWAELVALGKGGHGAMPWESANPIWILTEALEILRKKFPAGTQQDWQITVTPTMLSASDTRNKIPDSVTCGLDIRFPPELCNNAEEALRIVQSVLPEKCTVLEKVSASPLTTDSSHEMVQRIKGFAEEVEGRKIDIIREHGGTDARYFSEAGIPAFLYGPEGGDLHGANEWVSIPSLLQQYEISRMILRSLS